MSILVQQQGLPGDLLVILSIKRRRTCESAVNIHSGSSSGNSASELLVGVERANTAERRAQRGAFVENLLTSIPVLEFSIPVTRTHARMIAALSKNLTAGAQDALIAATAVHHGFALLTRNVADFKLFAGLKLEVFSKVT